MAAIKQFIQQSVGDGKRNTKSDVKSLQQLLTAAGETVAGGDDGTWGKNTGDALEAFQRKHTQHGASVRRWVDPGDHVLLLMAWRANILIEMPGQGGFAGIETMHGWFVRNGIRYNPGAEKGLGNRAIFGIKDELRYAVQTIAVKFQSGPVEMDCTTYVNLMLSIYMNGNVHVAPYDASCSAFGGTSATHCARDRYQLPLVVRDEEGKAGTVKRRYFESSDQIASATANDSTGLFVLEVATAGTGSVTHMGLLFGGNVYECTTGQSGAACISRSLQEFCRTKSGKIYYLFGPSATRR